MKYTIPINWTLSAELVVEANSLEEAIKAADALPLPEGPTEGAEYIDGSYEVRNELIPELNALNPGDQAFLETLGDS